MAYEYKCFRVRRPFVLVLIFFMVFIAYFECNVRTSFDSRWSTFVALSIIRERNTDLDEYSDLIKRNNFYAADVIGGHIYNMHPLGASIVALPFVFVKDSIYKIFLSQDLEERLKKGIYDGFEKDIASFVVALTAVFIYLIARLRLGSGMSLIAVFIFSFCTSAWSTASRALWQHGPSMLMLSIALYIILLAKENPRLIQYAALPLAFSYVTRPTDSIPFAVLSLYALIRHRPYFIKYALWALVIFVPFLLYNYNIYHAPLSNYYMHKCFGSNPYAWEGLAGNVISPARGLFVFSPVLIFSIYGMLWKVKSRTAEMLDYFLVGTMLIFWVVSSCLTNMWYAGHCYGPRFSTDMTPYFIYFIVPALTAVSSMKGIRRAAFSCVFFCLMSISFFIHFRGATALDVYLWNGQSRPVENNLYRLWDVRDLQFLRGLHVY